MKREPYEIHTPDEYLVMEEAAEYKSEYYEGEVVAMAGATANHCRITTELSRLLGNALEQSSCEIFTSDMKIRIPDDAAYYYPEISVVCGKLDFENEKETVLKNPCLVVEVLSEGTAYFDKGRKLHHYKQLPSLKEYVLIDQINPQADVHRRSDDGEWELSCYIGLQTELELHSIGVKIKLADIYKRVKF